MISWQKLHLLSIPKPGIKQGFNPAIHGLRGLASMLVFIFHIYHMAHKQHFWPASANPVVPVFETFFHGVEIFFMISGFLITASLVRHRRVWSFLLDRAIRIYPVFLSIHILVFLIGPVIGYKWLADISLTNWLLHFTSNLFFIPGVVKDLPLAQLNAWTLSYEAMFYVVSAGIYWMGKKLAWPRWWQLVTILVVAGLCWWRPLCLYFLAGILTYWLTTHARPQRLTWHLKIDSGLYLLLFLSLPIIAKLTHQSWLTYFMVPVGWLVFDTTARSRNIFNRFLESTPLQYLGTVSYSYYLWHALTMFPLKLIFAKLVERQFLTELPAVIAFGFISLMVTLVAAHVSYLLLEKHAAKYLKQKLK